MTASYLIDDMNVLIGDMIDLDNKKEKKWIGKTNWH